MWATASLVRCVTWLAAVVVFEQPIEMLGDGLDHGHRILELMGQLVDHQVHRLDRGRHRCARRARRPVPACRGVRRPYPNSRSAARWIDGVTLGKRDRACQDRFELGQIAEPQVAFQPLHGPRRKGYGRQRQAPCQLGAQMLDQGRDVRRALPQARQRDRQHAEPVEEVFTQSGEPCQILEASRPWHR